MIVLVVMGNPHLLDFLNYFLWFFQIYSAFAKLLGYLLSQMATY